MSRQKGLLLSLIMYALFIIPLLSVSCDLTGSTDDETEKTDDGTTADTQDNSSDTTDTDDQSDTIQLPDIKESSYSVLYRSTPESHSSRGNNLTEVDNELAELSTAGKSKGFLHDPFFLRPARTRLAAYYSQFRFVERQIGRFDHGYRLPS